MCARASVSAVCLRRVNRSRVWQPGNCVVAARVNNVSGGKIQCCRCGREENFHHFSRRAGKRRAGAGRKLLVVIANNYGCIQELLAATAVFPLLCSRCVQMCPEPRTVPGCCPGTCLERLDRNKSRTSQQRFRKTIFSFTCKDAVLRSRCIRVILEEGSVDELADLI